MPPIKRLLACLPLTAIAACASLPERPPVQSAQAVQSAHAERHEVLNALLWMQRSLEFRVSTQQIYRDATNKLATALSQPGTAAAEQEGQASYASLPPAVIVDIDETVLDNSRYQAWRMKTDSEFEPATWNGWVRRGEAAAIPGALEFAQSAQRAGVHMIYISNRECEKPAPAVCPEKDGTIANLKRLGFPLTAASDVMFRGERAGWIGKESRRAEAGSRYRIVMMIGDDMRDLLPAAMVMDLRKSASGNLHPMHTAKIGERLFLLPNPAYGQWEDLIGNERCKTGDRACAARVLKRKSDALDAFDPAPR